jgi:hypothetical protein
VSGQLYDTVALFLGKEPLSPLNRRLDGSQNRPELLGEVLKLLPFSGTEGSRYKDQSVNVVRRTGLCLFLDLLRKGATNWKDANF